MHKPLLSALSLTCLSLWAAQPVLKLKHQPQAPPTPPPTLLRELPPVSPQSLAPAAAPTPYSIGNPTAEEQLYLEFINRARANPPAEAQRLKDTTDPDVVKAYDFFNVDLNLMVSQISAIAASPPLSFNANLIAAARVHSQDMLVNAFQGHTGTDNSDASSRMTAQGYQWTANGENVYASADSPFHGHAGFEADWGNGPGGMQTPPGHRNSIHNPNFREIGIGVVNGANTNAQNPNQKVGPQLVTQDFGSRNGLTPFVTGVVYYDLNTNGFYDLNEGIGGVTVRVAGASFYAVTANSGGYSVPVPANGSYSATFSATNLPDTVRPAVVSGNNNSKVDFTPGYSPPQVSGPNVASVNQNNAYTFTTVGAATAYRWRQSKLAPFTLVEGAEGGLANFDVETSPGYDVITSEAGVTGFYSFRLSHIDPPVDQILTLNRTIQPTSISHLNFHTRMSFVTSNQIARAQVSADGGQSWQDVWSQAGPGNQAEPAFTSRSISLANFSGREVQVRFVFEFTGGGYFPAQPQVGFYFDDLTVTDAQELLGSLESDVPAGSSFIFVPTEVATYSLQVQAKVSDRFLPFGPARTITAQVGPPPDPEVQISSIRVLPGDQVQIDFSAGSSQVGTLRLESSPQPAGGWSVEAGASIQPVQPGYRATVSIGGATQRYYRISMTP